MAYTHAYVSSVEPLQISSTRSLSIRWSLPADASNTKAVARDSTESIFDPHRLLCEPCVVTGFPLLFGTASRSALLV